MPTPTHTVTCTQNKEVAKSVHELRFTKPSGFNFEPGQFILFQVPDVENPDDTQPRAYSIASSPKEEELLFTVRIVEGGRAGKWFSSVLKEGTEVEMLGPMGNFTLNKESPKGYLFVATGVGLSPFRSQVLRSIENNGTRQIDLIWCTYSEKTCFWVDELRAMEQEHPNFTFHLTLSEPSPEWDGLTGRVQQVIPTIPEFSLRQIYICGNPAMTSDVKKLCLEEWGFPKEDVHIEGYI